MTDLGNKEIMAKNIARYMERKGITRVDLCDALDLNYSTVSEWLNARKYPRIDKIELMAKYFGITKADLVEDCDKTDSYYLDPETAAVAQDIADNPDLHMLFSALRDSSPEDLKLVADMVKRFKGID